VGVFLDLNEDQQYELTSLKLNNTKRLHPAVCSDKKSHIRGMYLPEIFIVALLFKSEGYIRKYTDSSCHRHTNNGKN
jgi:hypothetical protein